MLLASFAPAKAEYIDTHRLHEGGDWVAEIAIFTTGNACSAGTISANGTVFDLAAWHDGTLSLNIFFPKDSFFANEFRDVSIMIDGKRWNLLDAAFTDDLISFVIPVGDPAADRLINDVRWGRSLQLLDRHGRTLINWSLRGSRAALAAMGQCIDRL
jgi:hypothetical protein